MNYPYTVLHILAAIGVTTLGVLIVASIGVMLV